MRPTHLLSLAAGIVGPMLLVLVTSGAGCDDCPGCFDGGVVDPEPAADVIVAADIGTLCTYNPSNPANPTNECRNGLTCLISTSDGAYSPFGQGDARNYAIPVWEDQFTVYRDDGIEEGYCTIVRTLSEPVSCPFGTAPKALSPSMVACVAFCDDALDCGREGYVCDSRFFGDFEGTHCARACTADVPDCVRTGWAIRPPATLGAVHLASQDITGASFCNVASGICELNQTPGTAVPSEPCIDSRDCAQGLTCWAGPVIGQPLQSPGSCMLPCKATQQPIEGCPDGYVCQAGFTYGFGNPLDPNLEDLNGFLLQDIATGEFLEGGGYCMPLCQPGGDCSTFEDTSCGSINTAVWGQQWNGVSQCLRAPLRLTE